MNTNKATEFETRVLELKRSLSESPGRRKERKHLWKEALCLLDESGLHYKEFAKRIGVTEKSVRNWRDAVAGRAVVPRGVGRKSCKMAAIKRKNFKQLTITRDAAVGVTGVENRIYSIDLAGGARVMGLSIEDIARLLKSTGGGA